MINKVLEQSGAMLCVDCGKCVAVCPMAEMYEDFSMDISPRGIIQKALSQDFTPGDILGDILGDAGLWRCIGCDAGTRICPEGVSCRDLVKGLQTLSMEKRVDQNILLCTRCGLGVTSLPIAYYIQQQVNGKKLDYLSLCPACRQQVYMERNTME